MVNAINKERVDKDLPILSEEDAEKDAILSLIIRINDVVNVITEFQDFKQDCCFEFLTQKDKSERAVSKFDSCYPKLVEYKSDICHQLSLKSLQQAKVQQE